MNAKQFVFFRPLNSCSISFSANYFRFQHTNTHFTVAVVVAFVVVAFNFLSVFFPADQDARAKTEFSHWLFCHRALGISRSCFSDTVSRCRECKSAVLHVNMRNVFLVAAAAAAVLFLFRVLFDVDYGIRVQWNHLYCCAEQLSSRIFHKYRFQSDLNTLECYCKQRTSAHNHTLHLMPISCAF